MKKTHRTECVVIARVDFGLLIVWSILARASRRVRALSPSAAPLTHLAVSAEASLAVGVSSVCARNETSLSVCGVGVGVNTVPE